MQDDEMADEADTTDTEMSEDSNTNNGADTSTATQGTETTNSVTLAENETGNFAVIATAQLSEPGYVAIYKANSNGQTSYLGSTALLEAGVHTNVSVQLATIVAREETIVAVLHSDNGDGEFEAGSDAYMGTAAAPVVTDVDVVDIDFDDEAESLQEQVEAYIEAEATAESDI
jgi:hypothetical protein